MDKRIVGKPTGFAPRQPGRIMPRRDFLRAAGGVTAAAVLPGLGLFEPRPACAAQPSTPPNILFILVDEMRFPEVFPAGINSPGEFLARFMPNTFELWRHGVKFANHFTAATACTPGRGTLISGLYSQQSWCVLTILSQPGDESKAPQPVLNRDFPTYGKLLRQAGYRTPYIGKWHLSIVPQQGGRLEAYGFDGLTFPDPTGVNLQGTFGNPDAGYLNDQNTADQAADWLSQRRPGEDPWCLTVGFVNPHDKEFFWAGTEFQTSTNLFANQSLKQYSNYSTQPSLGVSWDDDFLNAPPPLGYPVVPPNWESAAQMLANKPRTQTVIRQFCELVWGGITDDPAQTAFSVVPYPGQNKNDDGIGKAPFSYWQRGLDSYTQILGAVDARIGQVVAALPPEVARNTVILLTSDHGEYGGAHGLVSGKVGTGYDECLNVPLIVVDPTGRFARDIDVVRTQLTSSVDFLPLVVTLGYNGKRNHWLRDSLVRIYGSQHRLDLMPILRSASAPGRRHVLFATDETMPSFYNFLGAPTHIVGVRTPDAKLCLYTNWREHTTEIVDDDTIETEFYDYSTPGGRAEVDNTPDHPLALKLRKKLLNDFIPHQLRAPLPSSMRGPQELSERQLVLYLDALAELTDTDWQNGAAITTVGYGLDVP